MRILLALSVLPFVAAWGVAAPPTPPQSTTPGLSITGEARMGVAGRL